MSLFLFRADRDVYIVGITIGNAVAPRGGLGGGVCRQRGRRTYWIYILERLAIPKPASPGRTPHSAAVEDGTGLRRVGI